MTRDFTRQLSLAASSRKIGFAFFIGRNLVDWGTVRKASRKVADAHTQTIRWINFYVPSRLFVEEIDGGSRKGRHTIAVINAFVAASRELGVPAIAVPRRSHHKSRYFESIALAETHPQLIPWVPKKRRYWSREPMQMSMFEAVALVEEWYAVNDRQEGTLNSVAQSGT